MNLLAQLWNSMWSSEYLPIERSTINQFYQAHGASDLDAQGKIDLIKRVTRAKESKRRKYVDIQDKLNTYETILLVFNNRLNPSRTIFDSLPQG